MVMVMMRKSSQQSNAKSNITLGFFESLEISIIFNVYKGEVHLKLTCKKVLAN